jgi:hypothetical protein
MTEHILKGFIVISLMILIIKAGYGEYRRYRMFKIRDFGYWTTFVTDIALGIICIIVLFNIKSVIPREYILGLIVIPFVRYGFSCVRDAWNLFTQDICHIAVHFIIGRFKVRVKGNEDKKKFIFTWTTRAIPEFTKDRIIGDVEFSLNDLAKLAVVGIGCQDRRG